MRLQPQLDADLKLHTKEFEVLPEAWDRLTITMGSADAVLAVFQRGHDLDRMEPEDAEHLIATSALRDYEKQKVATSPPTPKQLQQFEDWKTACAEASKDEQELVNEYADLWRAVRWHKEHPGQIASK